MKNNNKRAFTSVEIMLVVCAIVVTMYVVAPAVKATGGAIGKWMSTPTATATASPASPCPTVAQQAAAAVDGMASVLSTKN